MNSTVWKYTLEPESLMVDMPHGAKILSVREQHGEICLWALVDPDAASFDRREFVVIGTGEHHSGVEGMNYLGTVLLTGGHIVLHVFEKPV